MIDLLAMKRQCLPMRGLCFSSSKNKSSSSPTDQQIGASDEAMAIGVVGSSNTVTLTDAGAISGALDLAVKGIEGAYSLAGAAQASNGGLLDGALKNAAAQNEQFSKALSDIKGADVRVLVIAGLAVVALVGASMFKKG